MKKLLALMLSMALVISMSSVVFAADAEVVKTDAAPTIDGEIDAVWDNANVYEMPNYIVAVHDNAELDPKTDASDLSGEWRALWDENNFYLLFEITDPERISINVDSGRGEKHYDDSANVYITPALETAHTQALLHITSGSNDLWHGPPDWADLSAPDTVQHAINDNGDGYIIEMAFPWDQVGQGGTTPEEGKTLLFDVHAVDNDLGEQRSEIGTEGRYPQAKITWSDLENKAYENNEHLGEIVLTAAGGGEAAGDTGSESEPASGDTGSGSEQAPAPAMPNTGMGGSDNSTIAPWVMLAAAALMIVFAAGIRKFRSQS